MLHHNYYIIISVCNYEVSLLFSLQLQEKLITQLKVTGGYIKNEVYIKFIKGLQYTDVADQMSQAKSACKIQK